MLCCSTIYSSSFFPHFMCFSTSQALTVTQVTRACQVCHYIFMTSASTYITTPTIIILMHTHKHTHTHYYHITSFSPPSHFLLARQDGDDTETPGRWSHVWPRHHSCLCNAPIILLGYVELSKKKKKNARSKSLFQCRSNFAYLIESS